MSLRVLSVVSVNVTVPDISGIVDIPDAFKLVVFKSSIKTPPLNVETPRTSNNCVGCVLPIPIL